MKKIKEFIKSCLNKNHYELVSEQEYVNVDLSRFLVLDKNFVQKKYLEYIEFIESRSKK